MTTTRKTDKPRRRERELHAKERLGNMLDSDTRTRLENLREQLEKEYSDEHSNRHD